MFDNIITVDKNSQGIIGLTSELKAIYIYNYYRKFNESLLVVCNTLYEANMMFQVISNYIDDVLFFPMDDFITSKVIATSPELKNTRLETIDELISSEKSIVITNLMGFLRYLPSKEIYLNNNLLLEIGKEYKKNILLEKLYNMGYERESLVTKTGELAERGFILDVFPINEKNPIRIEFFDDVIESIRIFDVDNQLTIKKIDKININPNTEILFNNKLEKTQTDNKIVSIIQYMTNPKIIIDDLSQLKIGYKILQEDIINYNKENNSNDKYMFSLETLLNNYIYFEKNDNYDNNIDSIKVYKCHEIEPFNSKFHDIAKQLDKYIKNKKTVIICLNNRYQVNKIIDNLEQLNTIFTNELQIFENKINLIVKKIVQGFVFDKYVVISENEIFGKKNTNVKYKSKFKLGNKIRNINKLQLGDYIVHNTHGIGRYIGMKTLEKNGLKKDYLTIEYKDNDKLYIPVEKIDLISKYSANDGIVPKLNKLGTLEWEKTKLRVRKKLENIAGELLKLYAERESKKGFAFVQDDDLQMEFEKEFPYQETVDQLKVIEEIKQDMESEKPMDRLLCGDVGYGKTEVAFRAIFKAVLSKKQVAFLCPTTILSNQHYKNALERFKNFPVNICLVNRFVSSKDINRIKSDISMGKIDIVIGTHRLLSDDIIFNDLGLLVVDEEQRFGVKHKEKIKNLKTNIDVLTLSATPIPRTLQMSMTGIRNLSLIETPPVNRYPVQTYVLEENTKIIKDAIYKELSRNGQIFILYNHVDNMENKYHEISKLVPDAKIIYAHGRMTKNELENIMNKFINHEYDILICTTIIETGIDIPNVNTLLILEADHFGLSQLYQIRGRVGRSNKIAYCYLMYKVGQTISEIAQKRLDVIKEFTELGSGFAIAMRDLAIRGAGDILGSEQAGFIDSIGIDLYLKMLNEEVRKLNGEKIIENKEEQPLISVETSISDDYIKDDDLKIEIHKKINTIDSYEKLHDVKIELEDRFGNLNEKLIVYMYEEWFEKIALKIGITNIKQTKNFIEITIPENLTTKLNGELLFIEINQISRMFRFSMKHNNLIITLDIVKLDKHFIYYLIEALEVIEKALNIN